MNIIIRADASIAIGSGHVMRCLTIAYYLRQEGCQVSFWMEPLEGNLIDLVKSKGYSVIKQLQAAVDMLIIDHYELGISFEQEMRRYARSIVVIDDLANRRHDCDLLIDQNVVPNYKHRYDHLLPEHCKKLLGPNYLIMRQEFIDARLLSAKRDGVVSRLLVFMGGSDPTGETLKVLRALQQTTTVFSHVDVVVGASNPDRDGVEVICRAANFSYHCQIDNMASLMQRADFSIGAGGAATWERCYVGLPSSSTIVAHNQKQTTELAAELGAVINLGWHEYVTMDHYTNLLNGLPSMKKTLQSISEQSYQLTESQDRSNAWLQEMVGLFHD